MSTELSNCPFCGSADTYLMMREDGLDAVMCNNCTAEGPGINNRWHAIDGWNRRASPAAAVPEDALPPLPKPDRQSAVTGDRWHSAEAMQAYARAAVEEDRARQQDMSVRLAGAPARYVSINERVAFQALMVDLMCSVRNGENLTVQSGKVQALTDFIDSELEAATRCRAEGGDGAPEAGAEVASNSAETRMDAGFDGGAGMADRAQQGEPVARVIEEVVPGTGITARGIEFIGCSARPGDNLYRFATKAAAPADAGSQQQEMVVRVAPAPAGQHDAGWISVSERLPSDNCRVLAATWMTLDGQQHIDIESFRSGPSLFTGGEVTHWMPLPEIPQRADDVAETRNAEGDDDERA